MFSSNRNIIIDSKTKSFNNLELINDDNIKDNFQHFGCNPDKNISILIQYLDNPISFYDFYEGNLTIFNINSNFDVKWAHFMLYTVFYQIYMPLSILKNSFTHYDLHKNNVLLYKLDDNKFITFKYYIEGQVVSFNSKYIVKIIDYGRSYFKETDIFNSLEIKKIVCDLKECTNKVNNKCNGTQMGLQWLTYESNDFNILSSKLNNEYDSKLFNKFVSKLFYKTRTSYKDINNIVDIEKHIRTTLNNPIYIKFNEGFDEKYKLGTLNIYSDNRPMEFIKNIPI
jgi:hypothetical protein